MGGNRNVVSSCSFGWAAMVTRSGSCPSWSERMPLRERFHEQLVLALYRSGRQADALRAYGGARRTLVEELGIEPGADAA